MCVLIKQNVLYSKVPYRYGGRTRHFNLRSATKFGRARSSSQRRGPGSRARRGRVQAGCPWSFKPGKRGKARGRSGLATGAYGTRKCFGYGRGGTPEDQVHPPPLDGPPHCPPLRAEPAQGRGGGGGPADHVKGRELNRARARAPHAVCSDETTGPFRCPLRSPAGGGRWRRGGAGGRPAPAPAARAEEAVFAP